MKLGIITQYELKIESVFLRGQIIYILLLFIDHTQNGTQ